MSHFQVIMVKCFCWPNSIGIEKKYGPEEEARLLEIGIDIKNMANCDFVQHANCVAPLVSNFEPSKHWLVPISMAFRLKALAGHF